MVEYFILKGGALGFTTTQPEAFHYYDDYWVNNDGVIKWHNEESHQRRKAQKFIRINKKRVHTNCLTHIKILGLVYVRRRKTRNRKIVEITRHNFFFV